MDKKQKIKALKEKVQEIKNYGIKEVDYFYFNHDDIFEFHTFEEKPNKQIKYMGFIMYNFVILSAIIKKNQKCEYKILVHQKGNPEMFRATCINEEKLKLLQKEFYDCLRNKEKVKYQNANTAEFYNYKEKKITKKLK